jgi:hypothetical protein
VSSQQSVTLDINQQVTPPGYARGSTRFGRFSRDITHEMQYPQRILFTPIKKQAMTSVVPTGNTRPNTGRINHHAIGQQTANAGHKSNAVCVSMPTTTPA